MEFSWKVQVTLVVLLNCFISSLGRTPCPPPMQACMCQHNASMQCYSTGLTQFPDPKDIPKSYTGLEFFNNTFIEITSVNYPWLTHFMVKDCKVKSIKPGAFINMTNLKELDLSSNSLASITKPMFEGLSSVTHLTLANNVLKSITKHSLCPSFLKSLTHLELEYNQIESLPKDMMISPYLSILNLGNNKLKEIPNHIWGSVKMLKQLKLHGNPLQVIRDESVAGLGELEVLNIDSCMLSDISENALLSNNKLKVLLAGNNQLTYFEASIVKPCANTLETLHLQNNKLHTLDQAIGHSLTNLKDFNIANNPWTCDCKIHWIHADFKKAEEPKCNMPENVKGELVVNVTSTMNCKPCTGSHCKNSNRGVIALAVSIPILIICAGLIAFFLWRIAKSRKEDKRKSVRYSAVYRDTVEANKHKGALST